ncbi:MAG: acyltransferase [Acetobacter okinawensis]|uniref:acyltransferase family protein n=2 Tax=Acetobacter okinawensis TaxID=1076594 RepID=UPI001BA8B9F0|nr:acyltransferase [Acetobacter okinawensis]MBS0966262.1 acyltransferase [Acetobacter okinawensis]
MSLTMVQQTWKDKLKAEFFPLNRRRDVDGLRGLAVLLVMIFHAGWLKGGFVGVDIFIVISGYFMGRSAFMQHPFRPERFVLRRLYRLVPALLVMILLVSASMLWWVLPSDRADIAQNGAYSLIYLSNIWASHHVGYFEGQSIAYPFLHTWSLSLEMQFYLIIFLIALLLSALRYRQAVLYVVMVTSFAYSMVAYHAGDQAGYYNIFARLWEFCLGTVIWVLPALPQSRLLSGLTYALSVVTLVLCGVFYNLAYACPSYMALLPCVATMLIIMQPHAATRRLLEPLSPVGVISYSLYLWHWPAIVMATYVLASQVQGMTMALVLGGAVIVGTLSYICVERPMLNYENSAIASARQRGAIVLVGLCLVSAAGLAWLSAMSRVH